MNILPFRDWQSIDQYINHQLNNKHPLHHQILYVAGCLTSSTKYGSKSTVLWDSHRTVVQWVAEVQTTGTAMA